MKITKKFLRCPTKTCFTKTSHKVSINLDETIL